LEREVDWEEGEGEGYKMRISTCVSLLSISLSTHSLT